MRKVITIDDLNTIAKKKGGKCLSSKYLGYRTKLKWKCSNKHIWKASPDGLMHKGRWCPICAGNYPLSINQLQKIAIDKGGKCLSKKYFNARTKLKWMCSKGHAWEGTADAIKNKNTWCPKCIGVQILTIKEMQSIAKKRR